MKQPYSTISILIADDHEMVREGLRLLISKLKGLEIIGEAVNGVELLQQTRQLKPNVILTDVRMPVQDGIVATRQIKAEFPHIGIIALSSFDEENLILEMIEAGANGYLLKNAGKQELLEAVTAAYSDEAYYCKHTSQKLAKYIAGRGFRYKNKENLFTEREREVILLICDGLSSKQIAHRLSLKTRTVERYRDAIMEKMEVHNAAAVVAYAHKHGLNGGVKKT